MVPQVRVRSLHDNLGGETLAQVGPETKQVMPSRLVAQAVPMLASQNDANMGHPQRYDFLRRFFGPVAVKGATSFS